MIKSFTVSKPDRLIRSLDPEKSLLQEIFKISLMLSLLFITSCATSKLGSSGQEKINGKTFVIIGASTGFGRGVAEQLGEFKANVVLASRRKDLLEEVAGKVRNAGGTHW